MITLGGNITLDGFDELDPGQLIVVKKMVGLFAKKVQDNQGSLDGFDVKRDNETVTVKAVCQDKTFEDSATDKNLFVALSNALKSVEDKSKQ